MFWKLKCKKEIKGACGLRTEFYNHFENWLLSPMLLRRATLAPIRLGSLHYKLGVVLSSVKSSWAVRLTSLNPVLHPRPRSLYLSLICLIKLRPPLLLWCPWDRPLKKTVMQMPVLHWLIPESQNTGDRCWILSTVCMKPGKFSGRHEQL